MKTKSLVVSILGFLGLLGIGYVYRNSMLARGSDLVTDVDYAFKRAKATEDAKLLAKQKAIIDAGMQAESGKPTGMLSLANDLLAKEQAKVMADIEAVIESKAKSIDRRVLATLISGQDELNHLLLLKSTQASQSSTSRLGVQPKKIRIAVPVTSRDTVFLELSQNDNGEFVIKHARD